MTCPTCRINPVAPNRKACVYCLAHGVRRSQDYRRRRAERNRRNMVIAWKGECARAKNRGENV